MTPVTHEEVRVERRQVSGDATQDDSDESGGGTITVAVRDDDAKRLPGS